MAAKDTPESVSHELRQGSRSFALELVVGLLITG